MPKLRQRMLVVHVGRRDASVRSGCPRRHGPGLCESERLFRQHFVIPDRTNN
jgi:hypothetical protein